MRWSHLVGACLVLGSCTFSAELDGQPTLAFATPTSGADEASTVLMIPVSLSRVAELEVSVDYAVLAGGNATAGADFVVTSNRLVFAPGELEKLIPVTINADADEMEMAETFQLALSSPTNAQLDEERAIHSVRIADHILPRVTIGPGFTMSSEASPSSLIVKLDRPAEGPSTVTIGVAAGAPFAASAADYTITDNAVVSFAKGESMKLVEIGEKNDALDEEDEEVVAFSLRGATDNLVVGVSRTMDHKIMDDDASPTITFTSATANVDEPNLVSLLTVSLDKPSGREVRVDYIRDGNDTADANDATVTGSPSTLTFDAGQQSKTILITVANDDLDEDNETVLVNLSNAVNATIGTLTHTLTILDNDTSTVSFQAGSSTVDEDSPGGVTLTVRLSTPSSKTVTVPFSVNGGLSSAEADDFTIITASPLTFAPGVTTATIEIDVPDNSPGSENDDRVVIDLGTPTNAPLGTPARHTLTITE
jgi:Calx-beta domain